MLIKNIIGFILFLSLSSSVLGTDFETFGYVSQTYLESTDNQFAQEYAKGTEAGLGFSVKEIIPHLDIRSLISYDNAKVKNKVDFEYFLADLYDNSQNSFYGVRLGRLQLPYGFHNELRVLPSTRLGVIAVPPTIIWTHNKALYDNGDGAMLYYDVMLSNIKLEFEVGQITKKNIEPQLNYVRGLVGVTSEQVKTNFHHIQLNYKRWSLRYDNLSPTQTFNVSQDYWDADPIVNSPNAFMLNEMPTGNMTVDYNLQYYGLIYWGDEFIFSLEVARFYFLGTGTLQNAYNAYSNFPEDVVSSHLPQYHQDHYNVMLRMPVKTYYEFIFGYGGIDASDAPRPVVGTERYIGYQHQLTENVLLKLQYMDVQNIFWLEYEFNRNYGTRNFKVYAIGISYDF